MKALKLHGRRGAAANRLNIFLRVIDHYLAYGVGQIVGDVDQDIFIASLFLLSSLCCLL